MRNILCLLACFVLLTGCDNSNIDSRRATFSCMGDSSANPFFNVIFMHYKEETGSVIRNNVYSNAAGFRSLQDKTIDFISSDVFLSDEELQRFPGEVLHIPVCLGAIVMAYNIPGVSELNLSGSVLACIYLDKITYWDDVLIKAINPNIKLPHLQIEPIKRIDGSGANDIFSDYLSRASPEWSRIMGKGKILQWTSGITANGNIVASEQVRTVPGSIGYVSAEHADILNLKKAYIQNSSGKFVEPTKESILVAADMDYPDDMRVMIANSDKEEAYPLSCISWFLVYKNQAYANRKIQKQEALQEFLYFSISPLQQKIASGMSYVALPGKMTDKSKRLIESMVWEN